MPHRVRIGTAGFSDSTLVRCGRFYPRALRTSEQRLRFYADQYSLVEIDASYYAIPNREHVAAWASRTPNDFLFNIKAFAPLTGHPTSVASLDPDLRECLPPALTARERFAAHEVDDAFIDEVWRRFLFAIEPLREAEKFGAILLQYPPWFGREPRHLECIERDVARVLEVRGAKLTNVIVELRHESWFRGAVARETLMFFRHRRIPFACVDMPQGFSSSVPPFVATTSNELAVVRLHGRNTHDWGRAGATVAEKYRYLYNRDELEPWARGVARLAQNVEEVHVVMNNCFEDFGVRNALDLTQLTRHEVQALGHSGLSGVEVIVGKTPPAMQQSLGLF